MTSLKLDGPQTTEALAQRLGVSRQAVRQQADRLKAQGLIAHVAEKGRVGRPRFVWTLAPAGQAVFPDGHAEALVGLIASVRATLGEAALDTLIADRERQSLAGYRAALAGAEGLADRVERLARQRTAEGYMAQVLTADDGALVLAENHCAICAAASACQGFCRSELAMFRELLGDVADVERTEHILAGARRCAYRIAPRA
ncbi:helix-turn-helix transcriptional regulator [Caulobacter sp. KR2-114]|uniref:helix-turn-helix transcriptional regulator n=1 Tax=Caulobacter sp. KR2-114 TaxID=3400912 RepID=UPI003C02EFBE